jgi:hypothetical protein
MPTQTGFDPDTGDFGINIDTEKTLLTCPPAGPITFSPTGKEVIRFTRYGMTVFWSDTMAAGEIKEAPTRDTVLAGRGTTDQQLVDFRDKQTGSDADGW